MGVRQGKRKSYRESDGVLWGIRESFGCSLQEGIDCGRFMGHEVENVVSKWAESKIEMWRKKRAK